MLYASWLERYHDQLIVRTFNSGIQMPFRLSILSQFNPPLSTASHSLSDFTGAPWKIRKIFILESPAKAFK